MARAIISDHDKSPAANSMPFELRDSFKSKFSDSNQLRQSSVVTYANDKRSLSQAGHLMRSVEGHVGHY